MVGQTYYETLTESDSAAMENYIPYCYWGCGWQTCYWAQIARQPCLQLPCNCLDLNPAETGCICYLGIKSAARLDGWYVERTRITDTKYRLVIKGHSRPDCYYGKSYVRGELMLNPDSLWKVTQTDSCYTMADNLYPPHTTYCQVSEKSVQFAAAGDCAGCCACEDSGTININVIVERTGGETPGLTDTRITNLWESQFDQIAATDGIAAVQEFILTNVIIKQPRVVWDTLEADVSHDNSVNSVRSYFEYTGGGLLPDNYDMPKVTDGLYASQMTVTDPTQVLKVLKIILPRVKVNLLPIGTPTGDYNWKSVSIMDYNQNIYPFPVNKRLPTIGDAASKYLLPTTPVLGNYVIAVWVAPVGSDRIDALITDPQGRRVGTVVSGSTVSEIREIPDAVLLPDVLFTESGQMVGVAIIPDASSEDYGVTIYGKESADYQLQLLNWHDGSLIRDTTLSDTIGAGEVKCFFFTSANVNIDPDTINLASKGNMVATYIEVPGYDAGTIDLSSVRLNDVVLAVDDPQYGFVNNPEIADRDGNGYPELLVKFPRDEVKSILEPGIAVLRVTGTISTKQFMGTDTVIVNG
jgi:hypothetical protein